jgi:cell division protein FtsL
MMLALKKEMLSKKLYSEEPLGASPAVHRKMRSDWRALTRLGVFCIFLFTLVVIGYLSLCTKIVEEQYALDRCQAELPVLKDENMKLEIQVKTLSALSRIDRIARTQLHMVYPKERLVIVQEADVAEFNAPFFAWRLGSGEKNRLP